MALAKARPFKIENAAITKLLPPLIYTG